MESQTQQLTDVQAAYPVLVVNAETLGDDRAERLRPGRCSEGANCKPVLIRAEAQWHILDWRELWRARELVWLLATRDLKARYRQSLLGVLWTVLQPLMMMAIFGTLFCLIGKMPTAGAVPYGISVLVALLMWNFFAGVLMQSSHALQANVALINKIYCPRLIFPLTSVLTNLVDLIVGAVVFSGFMVWFQVMPTLAVILLPLFVIMAGAMALGLGLWISAMSIQRRDLRFFLPTVLQMWFFASPVVYDVKSLIPPALAPLYYLNPLAGILEGARWSLLGDAGFSWSMLAVPGPAVALLLVSGLYAFRRVERSIADYL